MDRKEYQRKYRQENKEKLAQKAREYRLKNKEKVQARKKEYADAHKEEKAEYDRQYRAKNRERLNQQSREYRQRNEKYIKEQQKEYREKNPNKNRNYQLKRNYNLTPEQYDEMYSNQHGRCAICGVHQSELAFNLAVDHDHETGEVRGLLCRKCNSGIGYFKDDMELINKALDYLKER